MLKIYYTRNNKLFFLTQALTRASVSHLSSALPVHIHSLCPLISFNSVKTRHKWECVAKW
jgi:hypothetical protein